MCVCLHTCVYMNTDVSKYVSSYTYNVCGCRHGCFCLRACVLCVGILMHTCVRACFEGIYTCEFLFLNSSERLCARLFMCACECGYTCVSVCSCARVNIPTYASVRARVCVTLCSCESDHC